MNLKNQKRMAAEILKCGENRVWIDPNRLEDVEDGITRADIRTLVASGTIRASQKRGVSRARARTLASQRSKGRRKGHGSRKGTYNARKPGKKMWMQTIRPIRRRLKELRDSGKLPRSAYRSYYMRAKGGMFRSVAHLETQLRLEGYLKEEA